MTKTAKKQLKKNNTKKMKGGNWFMDTFNKITGRQQSTSNDDPNILDQKALIKERNKFKPAPGQLTEITPTPTPTPTHVGGRRRNTKKATRKAKKAGRKAKKGARKANKSRRTRK